MTGRERRAADYVLAAAAPVTWGTTYFVTTNFLPPGYPLMAALSRALPAGLLLLAIARRLPSGVWWYRILVLGILNFSLFFPMLYAAAYRLPGGVAATVVSTQPLLVVLLSRWLLGGAISTRAVATALAGLGGVAMTVLTPAAYLDAIGVVAGLVAAASMATGVVLSRRWSPEVPLLTFTALQLTAGGLVLLPVAVLFEWPMPALNGANLAGFAYLSLVGCALTYILWFQGISKLETTSVSRLALLSPVTATVIGVLLAGESLGSLQMAGVAIVLVSMIVSGGGRSPTRPDATVTAAGPVRGEELRTG
ncbi:DMT family transporter [Bradyrhizobium sp. 41S5]|uniref:DMT family transporter n=1 Tax=Bradyrhizobium sp. 41S5 TaxID=1404443 RepID=UPI00156AEF64|nr:DMT family transporter [Bradyrhizobium sp. 41S5]UFX42753.1 DMT family transporter [Bradyrhizobium sp. 41S5]